MKHKIAFLVKHPFFLFKLLTPSRIKKLIKLLVSNSPANSARSIMGYLRTQKQLAYHYELPEGTEINSEEIVGESTSAKLKNDCVVFPLVVPEHSEPLVSIIVPVYNQWAYTAKCIRSVIESVEGTPYEIILADDCSNDETQEADKLLTNVKISKPECNVGFLLNCNLAAEQASGKYIVLLNNDTLVHKGWLESLVKVAEQDDTVGLVGSKLVYEDGSLQEAGGIVWRDASAWNFGNGDDPNKPEYNYLKKVDYISGASILIRSSCWKELGGFDTRYVPAYYEDTDFAFALVDRGYKVVYQPKSVVTHFEGKSHGTDTSSGLKAYQIVNQKKFREKWRFRLSQHQLANGQCTFQARDRSLNQRTILIVDHYVPWFDQDAGSRSTFMYIRFFVDQGYNVKFIGDNFYPHQPYTDVLEQMGVEVLHGKYYANHWKEWFIQNKSYIDLVYLHRPHIAEKYIDFIKEHSSAKILYQCHDLHHWRLGRSAKINGCTQTQLEADKWKNKELTLFNKSDLGLTFSYDEKAYLKELDLDCKVEQVPLFLYDHKQLQNKSPEFSKRDDFMFVGGFNHTPNAEGVLWFLEKVFPIVLKSLPDLKFHIIGSKMPDRIRQFESGNVIIHGFISDSELERMYNQVKVNILPLLHGAGVKGKLVESLYFGTPIVSTSIGIEGIGEASVKGYDDPIEFANELVNLLVDESSWTALLQAQKEVFTREFYLPNVRNRLLDVF